MLNQPALKIGQNLRLAELEGEHFNGMLFIIFSGCGPLAAQSACLKMTFFQWSRPFHTILAWFLTYHLEVFMAYIYIYILTFYLALSGIYSGILSGIHSEILSGIYSDILSGICSDILSGIYSDILSGIYWDILSGIYSGIYSGMLSGIYSDILSGIYSDILSGIYSDILSSIYSDILSGICSDILSGIYSDILSGIYWDILAGIYSDMLSGIYSDILSGIYSDILSGIEFWHSLLAFPLFGSKPSPQRLELAVWDPATSWHRSRREERRRGEELHFC